MIKKEMIKAIKELDRTHKEKRTLLESTKNEGEKIAILLAFISKQVNILEIIVRLLVLEKIEKLGEKGG